MPLPEILDITYFHTLGLTFNIKTLTSPWIRDFTLIPVHIILHCSVTFWLANFQVLFHNQMFYTAQYEHKVLIHPVNFISHLKVSVLNFSISLNSNSTFGPYSKRLITLWAILTFSLMFVWLNNLMKIRFTFRQWIEWLTLLLYTAEL